MVLQSVVCARSSKVVVMLNKYFLANLCPDKFEAYTRSVNGGVYIGWLKRLMRMFLVVEYNLIR